MLFKKTSDPIKLYGHNNWKFDFFFLNVVDKKSKEIFGKKYYECKKACFKKKMFKKCFVS